VENKVWVPDFFLVVIEEKGEILKKIYQNRNKVLEELFLKSSGKLRK
jgi:hypothetical protein